MKQLELLMNGQVIDRTLNRIAHQIIEEMGSLENVGIIGMQTRGVFLARRIVEKLNRLENCSLQAGILDVTLYRDDYHRPFKQPRVKETDVPFDINDIDLILVDDVIYTGRTVRSALDAVTDLGRPNRIRLAVLVDRGHREMPIQPDYVGKDITTLTNQEVALRVRECDGEDSLWLMEKEK